MRRPGEKPCTWCVCTRQKEKKENISVNSKIVESIETVSLVSWWVPLKRRREKLKCGDVIANDYICVPYQQMWGFFSSSSSSSFTTPRCYAIGHTKTLYRREFQRKCHITSLATALPIERRSRITYDGGADWSIETEWMWQNCRCSSYFIALQEEYKQRTKNRFYILYIPMCIERLCDGGRQSHVINMEHWANMTGVSTDRRTRSIISLYSIRKKKKGFVTFSRSQALLTIFIILVLQSFYICMCPVVKGTNPCVREPEGSRIE